MRGIQVPLGKVGGGHLPTVSEMRGENMEAEAQKGSWAARVGICWGGKEGGKGKDSSMSLFPIHS